MKFCVYLFCASVLLVEIHGAFLTLPTADKCAKRPKEFKFGDHWYFYNKHQAEFKDKNIGWLDARNLCREYCMDAVSMETQAENDLILDKVKKENDTFVWTSGRLCDFPGCEGPEYMPLNINGWLWSASRVKIDSTNKIPEGFKYNPWSQTGHKKVPQPDNAEYDVNQTSESCMAVLNKVYDDGIGWHDVGCYHEKSFICEDNDELINWIAATNPGIKL